MRSFTAALFLSAAVFLSGQASAADLPARSDIEAVCDKFGPTNKEFCELVLQLYDSVDEINGEVGDVAGKVDRIPEHPHPAFGAELTRQKIDDLRADMEDADGDLDAKIGRVPEHPHPAFGYDLLKSELAELRAAIEELQGQ